MLIGLQTHFPNGLLGPAVLRDVYGFNVRLARLDVQGTDVAMMHAMIAEPLEANLQPLVTVDGPQQILDLPTPELIFGAELLNEPDGRIAVVDYRRLMLESKAAADSVGVPLYIPALSNLDENSLKYLNDLKPFPPGVKFSIHRYGDGTFNFHHQGFSDRAAEVKWLKAAIGWESEWGVSEFGYPNIDGLTEAQQAHYVAQEWAFWQAQGADFAVLFQLSDGPHNVRLDRFGIRAMGPDGSWRWKPVAYTFPPPVAPDVPQAPRTTFAVVVSDSTTHAPLSQVGVILSTGPEGFTNLDGYLPFHVEIGKAFNFSAHREGYDDFVSDVQTVHGNTDHRVALTPLPNTYPFPAEAGRLRIEGTRFYTEAGELWQWRGFSWFLGFLRFCRGEDVTPDLRWLRDRGFNIVRVFGPLPWKDTPDYRAELFQFDLLSPFFAMLEAHGLYCEFTIGHYRFPNPRTFAQRIYDISAQHWCVLIEAVNEPSVGEKPDPIDMLSGVDRKGVLTSYGLYAQAIDGKAGWPPVLDFGTIHTPRDAAWDRKARMAQEVQHATGKPWISDEPAKAIELDFVYPGGKRNPDEFVFHHAIANMFTAGSTLHTEAGKFGHVPEPETLQSAIVNVVREDVWLRIAPRWQAGKYSGSHMSNSPVHFERDVWAYSSILGNEAISVRVDTKTQSQPVRDWRIKDRWGPAGNVVILER